MKKTGKLIAVATFAASLLFTKGIVPAFRPGDGQNYDGYSAVAEDYAEALPAEEIPENFVEAKKVVCENELGAHAKSAYLAESKSGTEIFSKNETKRLPIASMCKIMTLLLAFDAVNTGVISMDESVIVSERAAGMGGSQVFLESGGEYKIRELLKSIAVCSANDSCVAIAEKIAGSEEAFVNRMNEKADYECTVAGRCCESGDLIQEGVKIPEPQRDDILAVLTTGAYNYAMSSNYNAITKPPVIMLTKDSEYVAVKRESFEDMTACQI